MKTKFLFELGTEEIPADMIVSALQQMEERCGTLLQKNHLLYQTLKPYSSPRRLSLIVEGLPDRQPDREEVVLGPPKSVAFDDSGNPTAAATGFARKQKVSPAELEVHDTDRGPYVSCRKKTPGQAVTEILPAILSDVVSSISWPKNMYWREGGFRFIRPLRWYVALWNEEVLPFEFQGVKAGRTTQGHRFLAEKQLQLSAADEYVEKLRQGFVLVDVAERRARIANELDRQTPDGLNIYPDSELTEMVVHLNEYPSAVCGSFAPEFLNLPKEVLITVMRYHQKYFSLIDEEGRIQPYFLTVLNTQGDPEGEIKKGHERVLRARLEDAAFFWQTDRKRPLEDRLDDLGEILFQDDLGTYRDKAERVRKLCAFFSDSADLDLAAKLCKVDLTTEMVKELTELQGVMGGLYAREDGHPEGVWKAIYEHYKPGSPDEDPPSTPLGAYLSIADKLDTIAGCFSVNIIPTGSSDPFALRRQAQGVVRILFDGKMDCSIPDLVSAAVENFSPADPGHTCQQVTDFLVGRARRIFQENGIPYDVLNAVLAVGIRSVHDAFERGRSLHRIKGEKDFEAISIAYKRIKNILSQQSIGTEAVSQEDLEQPEEQNLHQTFLQIQPPLEVNVANRDYDAALGQMANLRQTVDRFFDEVLVMTDDEKLRRNRLRLLYDISRLFLKVADLSEIVQEEDSNK